MTSEELVKFLVSQNPALKPVIPTMDGKQIRALGRAMGVKNIAPELSETAVRYYTSKNGVRRAYADVDGTYLQDIDGETRKTGGAFVPAACIDHYIEQLQEAKKQFLAGNILPEAPKKEPKDGGGRRGKR